jgi:hypothetical protein
VIPGHAGFRREKPLSPRALSTVAARAATAAAFERRAKRVQEARGLVGAIAHALRVALVARRRKPRAERALKLIGVPRELRAIAPF